jgi:hypothetical protein
LGTEKNVFCCLPDRERYGDNTTSAQASVERTNATVPYGSARLELKKELCSGEREIEIERKRKNTSKKSNNMTLDTTIENNMPTLPNFQSLARCTGSNNKRVRFENKSIS